MREILFRGKSNYGNVGEWEYGLVAQPHVTENGIVTSYYFTKLSENGYSSQRTVSANTIGQYTGLTDKNGKKIFEGDILGVGTVSGYVLFKSGYFVFCWKNNDKHRPDFYKNCILTNYMRFNELEVIGNIHDNPELLEGVKSDA